MRIFTKDRQLTPSWELVNPSIALLKKNFWPTVYLSFMPALLLTVGVTILGPDPQPPFSDRELAGFFVAGIAGVWSLLVAPGFIYLVTKAVQGKTPSTKEAFIAGLKRFFPFVTAVVLSALMIFFGLLLLIIPGLILTRALYLVPYYVLDQNMSAVDAIKASMRDTKPVSLWVWGVIGVSLVLALLGAIIGVVPIIGEIISLAVTYIYIFAPAIRYGEVTERGLPVAKLTA